jgi:pimeloyl-ACP methyl ester carboxylesterase
LLPGMLADDRSMRIVGAFLRSRGYEVLEWGMGRNRGPLPGVFDTLLALLKSARRRTGHKVSVVGWSLGGTLARVLANRHPELIRSVVTLASPHTGNPKASHLNWLYERATGHAPGAHEAFLREYSRTPDVPLTAVCTRIDGVIPWQSAFQESGPCAETVEVLCTHGAMGSSPIVMYVLAERLQQPEGQWRPFVPPWWFGLANGSALRSDAGATVGAATRVRAAQRRH